MPIVQRLPKRRGFRRPNRPQVFTINLSHLHRFAKDGVVTVQGLRDGGYLKPDVTVKILGEGDLKTALRVEAHAISQSARAKLEAAGGQVTIIGASEHPAPVDDAPKPSVKE